MIYLCLGRREMGKTTLGYYLIHQTGARVVFDPRGLFPTHGKTIRVTNYAQLEIAFEELYERGRLEIVITPDRFVQTMFERTSLEVKNWLRDRDTPIAFLVDELRFVDPSTEDFDWILRCSTRDAVTVVLTAHRPVDVSPDIRAISDVWCVFQTTQEHDLKVIAERCSPAAATQVQRLQPREFVAWDDTKGTYTIHRYPDRWFLPLRSRRQAPIDATLDKLDGAREKDLDSKLPLV